MQRRQLGGLVAITLALLVTGCAQPGPVRVMSLNAHATPATADREDWVLRQADVIDAVRSGKPDIAGLQDIGPEHVIGLLAALPDYAVVAAAGTNDAAVGDALPILYRRDRFTLIDSGQFWLSETPEEPGSVGWDAKQSRAAVWARLRWKDAPLTDVQILNVQFDEHGRTARVESAELIRRVVESLGARPLVVMGEFQCPAGSRPYQILTEDRRNLAALIDTHGRARSPAPRGALQAWAGRSDARTQWILVNRRFQTIRADEGGKLGDSFGLGTAPLAATLQMARPASGYT